MFATAAVALSLVTADARPAVAHATRLASPVDPAALLAALPAAPAPQSAALPDFPAPDPFAAVEGPLQADDAAADDAVGTPSEPVAEPAPASWTSGPPSASADTILSVAASLLGVPYLWGGNSTGGMDCSAYVSRAWGLPRETTDTLPAFSEPITKDQLLPGDAMNLTRAQDPRGYGHVRLFAAWANTDHTMMWVYEETPPRAVYHVIAYDPRYTPIRRSNFIANAAVAPLVPAPAPTTRPVNASAPTHTRPPNASPTGTVTSSGGHDATRWPSAAPTRPRTTPTPGGGTPPTWTPVTAPATPTPVPTRTQVPQPVPTRTPTPSPTRTAVASPTPYPGHHHTR